ncbi:MAG: phosphate ABC transporter substrate-binding protein PstS [Candidatus Binataceae bacterium]
MSYAGMVRTVVVAAIVGFAYSALASVSINGAGSTFIYPVFTKWSEAYRQVEPGVRFNYQSIGSLQGVDQLLSHSADFAASDAPLHLEQMNEPSCGTLYFPAVVGAVVMAYNLPQLPATNRLRLTGQVLGDIYLGKIKSWNDPAILALNPGTPMPSEAIIVNYRRDGSGTTFTFTDYLSKVSAQWAKEVGAGMLAKWPVGLSANGNEGVADSVKSQAGAIGYMELSYAVARRLPYALLQNRAGSWVDADQQTITAAAESLADKMPHDLQQSITDAPGISAYPISSYSYLLFLKQQKDPAKTAAFSKFVTWILHDGQSYAAPLHYAPLPQKVVEQSNLQLGQILANEAGTAIASCQASLGLAKPAAPPAVNLNPDTTGPLFSD